MTSPGDQGPGKAKNTVAGSKRHKKAKIKARNKDSDDEEDGDLFVPPEITRRILEQAREQRDEMEGEEGHSEGLRGGDALAADKVWVCVPACMCLFGSVCSVRGGAHACLGRSGCCFLFVWRETRYDTLPKNTGSSDWSVLQLYSMGLVLPRRHVRPRDGSPPSPGIVLHHCYTSLL